jgi:hypothetical protein
MKQPNKKTIQQPEIDAILRLLNRSTEQLDRSITDRLHDARSEAMKRHRAYQQAPVLAWLNEHGMWHGGSSSHAKQFYLIAMVVAAICLFSYTTYLNQADDHSDIDIAILTDDLPLDAYVE